jgi:hypothetical protein
VDEREREGKKQRKREMGGRVKRIRRSARIRESREEGQVGFSKGIYAKSENCRGLFVKQNFPLI